MGWTPCYSTPMEIQAYVVKGYLEQYGVPCMVENARFGMKPLTFGALGEVRVLVREDWLLIAQGLIRGREEQAPPPRLRLVRRSDT
jgi:Putative prokaryotic signal transducing protein